MTTTRVQRFAGAGVVALAAAGLLTACGSSPSNSAASFCSLSAQLNAINVDPSASPDELKAAIEKSQNLSVKAQNAAPKEIKDDVKTVVDAQAKIMQLLKDAGYDVTKVDQSKIAAIDTDAVEKASSNLDAYTNKNCPSTPPSTSAAPSS